MCYIRLQYTDSVQKQSCLQFYFKTVTLPTAVPEKRHDVTYTMLIK